ncbi:PREDICTED: uncharacterized protein LOC104804567 [Tarenaya hassleriana]|uniref:uncharacterized protein LOC104804567 n=1 Tax=Tarenaya hassleriana TaxID=28532 RepID=UPI00053C86E4|nr:PREDICTED: uncharacterized protein LOC104804567 [Tarenaya hassleriana]
MGGYTSKQDGSSGRWTEGTSSERRMRTKRGEKGEREVMAMAMEEAETEWRRERKRLKEEVKTLRKKVEEKEQVKAEQREWEWVVGQMCVERAVKDEAVERWKKLYLAIKNELDDLIQRTYGQGLHQRPEEEGEKTIQELRQQLKVREETIERLKERIALMEKQQYGKEREIDILRQSLRIISNDSTGKKKNKKTSSSRSTRNLRIFKNTCK